MKGLVSPWKTKKCFNTIADVVPVLDEQGKIRKRLRPEILIRLRPFCQRRYENLCNAYILRIIQPTSSSPSGPKALAILPKSGVPTINLQSSTTNLLQPCPTRSQQPTAQWHLSTTTKPTAGDATQSPWCSVPPTQYP